MTNIRCRGVLFDLDGVLVDSTPAVARVWAWWAREHGFDPNEVVGHGYETTEVELKDGRAITGRIVEDTPSRLKLVASGPTEFVIARIDIDKMRTSELSLMPDGLEQMPDPDFRNLVWYILNPPQDNRQMTAALRKEILGE